MASSFPNGLDTGFPGWPYVDNIEFVTAEQANSWIAAIQAIETAIGYGTGVASPLYSAAYGTTFPTLASGASSRLANVETKIVNGLKLNTAAGNIQSIGLSNQPGNSGLAADAAHVHNGVPPAGLLPIGSIILWPAGATTFPSGAQGTYLACNGQLISQGTYSTLFGIVGTSFGSGSGTFGLPNFNDRFPVGVGSVIAPSVGNTGGSRTIGVGQLPANIPYQDPGHLTPTYVNEAGQGDQAIYTTNIPSTIAIPTAANAGPGALNVSFSPTPPAGAQVHWQSAVTNITINPSGGNPFTQPFLGMYFLMRCL